MADPSRRGRQQWHVANPRITPPAREQDVLFATRYKFKGDQSPDTVKALLAVFAERGAGAGEIAHYVAADGRGGIIISENDSMQQGYEDALVYQQWMDFETTPVLTIADALPTIMKVFG